MTREELLNRAKATLEKIDPQKKEITALTPLAYAILCVLVAREMGEEEAVKQAEAEAEQMVAAQMEEEKASAILSTEYITAMRHLWEGYNNHLGDNVSEHSMDAIRRLTDSHRAANARIAELEEAIQLHKDGIAANVVAPSILDRELWRVLDKR